MSRLADFVAGGKAALASVVDALARIGERAPGVSSLTVTAAGVTVTLVPAPPAHLQTPPPPCPTCGKARQ